MLLSILFFYWFGAPRDLHSFPTRRSSDLVRSCPAISCGSKSRSAGGGRRWRALRRPRTSAIKSWRKRSEEHTSELQSRLHLVCRLLLEKKKPNKLAHEPFLRSPVTSPPHC